MTGEEPSDDDALDGEAAPDSFDALLRSVARTPSVLRAGASLAGRRFQIVRALGRGGMGVVYEALDASRAGRVALKTLTRCGAQELYRLKSEFRALADVAHPNLVALHEFICDGEIWFFTMDLVEGADFLSYVRGHEVIELAQTRAANESEFDEARLRAALRQLVQGVVALHEAGKLHCDLKPANVMVSKSGHLTILDFGLVSERVGPSSGRTLGNEWAGTPGYMAPEQMELGELTTASDYYAIGVMLYESLTGRLPFRGADGRPLRVAERAPAQLPLHLTSGSCADLAQLCLDLLAADPRARPNEAELVARTFSAGDAPAQRPSVPRQALRGAFVGREAELAVLCAACEELDRGPRAVLIRGSSGIGKSRLAHEFLASCREREATVVLEGRCYARESLPYNAFDSLIDALSRYLRRLPEVRALSLMPRDARLLVELFPVLERVSALAAMPAISRLPSDPLIVRRRAFAALKELFARVADSALLVLCIDDMHWADADSLQLLEAILSEPAPGMLLVGLFLSEPVEASAQVAALCARQEVACSELTLARLSQEEARRMIAEQLALSEPEALRMARASDGNPFFLAELIAAGARAREGGTDLGRVIAARAAELPTATRGLLDLLCAAGAPIELGVALQVAGLSDHGLGLVTELRNERWLRLDPLGQTQRVEIYHEVIRSVLAEALSAERRKSLLQALAACLEAQPAVDDEVVARYWLEAGMAPRAALGFARAALRAEKNLAFVSAGRLYGLALEHGSFERADVERMRLAMALAFEHAGHAAAAARIYLVAADEEREGKGAERALALRQRAAQLLLASGSLEAGIEVLSRVLSEVGLAYPESPDQALAWLTEARAALSRLDASALPVAGELARGQAAEELRQKADACWAAGPTLGSYDFVRAAYFAAHGLSLSLATGDALRIARGLAMYATSAASAGDTAYARALAERARALAEQAGDPLAAANAELVLGQVSLFAGDFAACLAASDRARAMFRGANAAESQEVHLCNMFANMALHMSGRLDELVARSREQLENARDRGHIQAEASLRVLGIALGHLARDEVELARQQGEISARLWPQAQFHGERLKVLRLEIWCDLYQGEALRAFQRFSAARDGAEQSHLLSSRYWSFWWFDLAAATALSAAAVSEGGERARLLVEAERALAKLEGMEPKYVAAQLTLYRAARAHLTGDARAALDGLRALCASAHPLLAASAQALLGALLGGPEGAALKQLGEQVLVRSVKSSDRWSRLMLPGFAGHFSAG